MGRENRGGGRGRVPDGIDRLPPFVSALTGGVDESYIPQYWSVHHRPLELGQEVIAELSSRDG